jgi:hypothetical protein
MRQFLHLLLVSAIAASLFGCSSGCENEVIKAVDSPSGIFKVVTFGRGCGATIGFNTQVSIVDADSSVPDDTGNVMIVDDEVPLEIRWLSDNELAISGWRKTEVFKQEISVNGVRIRYEN